MSTSPPGAPVNATTTRSRVSQARSDAVVLQVLLEVLLDLVGEPQQRDLTERREVADPEVVGERRVDAVGRVHVAVRHPPAQRLRCHVDQLDLLGGAHDLVGDRLLLLHAGDAFDDVVDRLEVLDVERRDHVDPGVEELFDVLAALRVPRARDVGVRELVDEHHRRLPRQDRIEVHLGELAPLVLDRPPRDHLELADLRLR